MHVLLVEDNHTIATTIKQFLELEWWLVDIFADWIQGLNYAQNFNYDCIILDVMLPGMDGFSLLAKLRETKTTPVIMTTAKWQLDDKAEWFERGADDYLVKPFELAELAMRIRSLVKRNAVTDIVRRWEIEIDFERNIVTKSGEEINLTLKEWQILTLLVDANGSTVQRATIIDEIWWDTGIRDEKSDGKLDVYIANLRKKLDKTMFETVKWLGYRFNSTTL